MKKISLIFALALMIATYAFSTEYCIDTSRPNTGYCWPGSNGNYICDSGPAKTCDGIYIPYEED